MASSNPHNKTTGAHTESTGIGPELMLSGYTRYYILWLRSIQPDIVKEHLTGTTGDSRVALGSKTNRNCVDVGQIDALIGKGL